MQKKRLELKGYKDPRIIRSLSAIQDALLLLMKEKDYNKITVTDITRRAGLARPTFYLHSKKKEDVLSDIYFNWLYPLYEERLNTWKTTREDLERTKMVSQIFLWHEEHKELVLALFQSGREDVILQIAENTGQIHLRNLEKFIRLN